MSDPKTQQQEPTMEEILASIRRIISEDQPEDGGDGKAAASADAAPAPAAKPAPAPASAPDSVDDDDFDDPPPRRDTAADREMSDGPNMSDDAMPMTGGPADPDLDDEDFAPEREPVSRRAPALDAEDPFDDPPARDEPAADDFDEDVLELTEVVDEEGHPLAAEAPPPPRPAPPQPVRPAAPPRRAPAAEEAPLGGFDLGALVSEQAAAAATTAFAGLADRIQERRGMPMGASARTLEELVKELLRPMLKEWLDRHLPAIVQRIVEREIAKLAGRADDR